MNFVTWLTNLLGLGASIATRKTTVEVVVIFPHGKPTHGATGSW